MIGHIIKKIEFIFRSDQHLISYAKFFHVIKGTDGNIWYSVAYGKTKGYIRSDLLKVTGKVPTR